MRKKLLYAILGLMGIALASSFVKWRLRNDKQDVWKQQNDFVVQSQGSMQSEQENHQQDPIEEFSIVNSRETTADINGDGVEEKIIVSDYRSENTAYTQVSAELADGSSIQIDFLDYWNSTIVPGDLNGDGAEEIVLVRWASGSTFGGGEVNILHAENGVWEKYENTLIQNPMYEGNPSDFKEENFLVTPLGGSIIEDERGQKLLRLIFPEDLENAIVRCMDCSYSEDGWYIENVQIFSDFYGKNNIKKLLNMDTSYNYIK